ncbi:hypothetical protein BET03_07905 [Thermohalobacter berrensis]|uniref:DUF1576 domain-containing protein n=1 Tax=Thermohalobacter berrensis TaxID=99594 RepID=A0A419T9R8_9FIRM|nr:hypothetical protein BET03_07905 [Thermohalobacter berrensis]
MISKKINNSKPLSRDRQLQILLILPLSFIIMAFIFDDFKNIIEGLYRIIVYPDTLITDYIEIGSLGAALINSALLTLINIYIVWKFRIRINGPTISAIFIISGFSFFGKNIFNVWPIYLGGYIYARYQKTNFKTEALITMFGTALSPLISEIAYGLNLPLYVGIPLGILLGILIGFVLPPLSSHMLRVHDGYSLYNIGFTAGFLGTVIMSLLRSYGFAVQSQKILSSEYDMILKIFLSIFFIILIGIGYYLNNNSFKDYTRIFFFSGRLVTDFTQLCGYGITLINMGLMGLLGILYVIMSKGTINGPIIGALLTVVGFSSFGKHPKNSLPILLGVFLASATKIWNIDSTIVIISGLFGTTLAPIAGEYGILSGIVAGFLHLSVVMNVGIIHGGINLYNNGFSGGIVASILVPIIDAFSKED